MNGHVLESEQAGKVLFWLKRELTTMDGAVSFFDLKVLTKVKTFFTSSATVHPAFSLHFLERGLGAVPGGKAKEVVPGH